MTFGRNVLVAAVLSGSLALAGCGDGGDSDSTGSTDRASDKPSVQLRASLTSALNDQLGQAWTKFAEEVSAGTQGRITVRVFPNGTLYDQVGEQQALARGDLDFAISNAESLVAKVPEVGIFTVPYLVPDADVALEALNGEIGKELFTVVESKAAVRPLAAMYQGTRTLNLTDVGRIDTPADLKKVRLRMPDTPGWLKLGNSLGAQAVPLAFQELYLAMQSGAVDGHDNPVVTAVANKLQEVTDQVVLTNHIVGTQWLSISAKAWGQLDAEDQAVIVKAAETAAGVGSQSAKDNEAGALETMKKAGAEIYAPANLDAFKEQAQSVYLEDAALTGQWIPGMLEKLEALSE